VPAAVPPQTSNLCAAAEDTALASSPDTLAKVTDALVAVIVLGSLFGSFQEQ